MEDRKDTVSEEEASWEWAGLNLFELRCHGSFIFQQELVTFAKYILGKFFALAAVNQKAFVELLFWKNTTVVREMTQGYGSLDSG